MSSLSPPAVAAGHAHELSMLQDDLSMEQCILTSLQEGDHDSETPLRIAASKRQIALIQRQISKARGETQLPKRPSKSNGTMDTWQRPGASAAGPAHHANSGNYTPASSSTAATWSNAPAQRKRPWGTPFDDDDSFGPRGKSRRTTPSPMQTAITTPSAGDEIFGDDDSMIDLTGDDVEIEQALQNQKLAYSRLERTKEDERLARSLQQAVQSDGSADSMPASPAPTGPNAFDRILGRPSQSSQGHASHGQISQQLPSQGPEQSLGQVGSSLARGPSQPNNFSMPGSFDADDEDDMGFDPSPFIPTRPYSASAMGSINTSMPTTGNPVVRSSANGLYPMITPGLYIPNTPAADMARQAALSRQQGYGPSGGYGAAFNLNGPASANGFASYAGDSSPMASLSNRPGTLSSGAYAPLQSWDTDNALNPHPTVPGLPGGYLGNIIDQTNQIDWDNGLDSEGNPLSARLRTFAEDLYDDPRKTAEEIKDLLANIRPDEEIPEEDRIGTPEALRYPLYPHQQLALQWMTNTENGKNKSGILADDSK